MQWPHHQLRREVVLGHKEAKTFFDKIMPYLYTGKFSETSKVSDLKSPSQMKTQRINIITALEYVGNSATHRRLAT